MQRHSDILSYILISYIGWRWNDGSQAFPRFLFFNFVLKGLGWDVGWAGFDTSTAASDGLCFRSLFFLGFTY